jgi:hypothetical protein
VNAEQIEVVGRHIATEQLDGLANFGQNKTVPAIRRDAGKSSLSVAIMPEFRDGKWQLL